MNHTRQIADVDHAVSNTGRGLTNAFSRLVFPQQFASFQVQCQQLGGLRTDADNAFGNRRRRLDGSPLRRSGKLKDAGTTDCVTPVNAVLPRNCGRDSGT